MSVRAFCRVGSSLSVAGDTRVAGNLRLEQTKKLFFSSSTTGDYAIGKSGGGIEVYDNAGGKAIAVSTAGNVLHGTWTIAS